MEPQPIVPPTQVTPVSVPTHPKWPWILGGIVLLMVGGLGGIFLGKQMAKPVAVTPTTAVDSTANWQTYTNTFYNFEIKYPADWVGPSRVSGTMEQGTLIFSTPDGSNFVGIATGGGFGGGPCPGQITIINSSAGNLGFCVQSGNTVDNKFWRTANEGPWPSKASMINLTAEVNSSNEDYVKQILSTFKFTTPIDTSTWKTYYNNQAGFSLQHPPSAKLEPRSDDPFPVAIEISELTPRTGGGGGPELEGWLMIISETQENPQHESLSQWAYEKKFLPVDPNYASSTTPQDTTIGGRPALTWKTSGGDADLTNYLIDRLEGITLVTINNSDEKNENTIQQILASITFTK